MDEPYSQGGGADEPCRHARVARTNPSKDEMLTEETQEGDKFVRLPEVYVKGNNIKYLRVPDEIIDQVSEQQKGQQGNFRGGRGGQSRGDHGGRGGDRGRGRGGRGRGRGRGQ
ncbi:hypothetical protein FZEAL_1695 [Fusarium zealandicum]|uniref:U6 snRNA-associated Sm-like protein LSm4 n=1 Tax=Fusarium zealandicum TaxID=1053134 RepID=A0A8H4US85_9HYPO|nr:hypothetical protein FZEAL_1695 [Fusarium zealandicum]